MSGGSQEEVGEHGEEGCVEAIAGRQRGQEREGQTWGETTYSKQEQILKHGQANEEQA